MKAAAVHDLMADLDDSDNEDNMEIVASRWFLGWVLGARDGVGYEGWRQGRGGIIAEYKDWRWARGGMLCELPNGEM